MFVVHVVWYPRDVSYNCDLKKPRTMVMVRRINEITENARIGEPKPCLSGKILIYCPHFAA
jgi:hypothetical protein